MTPAEMTLDRATYDPTYARQYVENCFRQQRKQSSAWPETFRVETDEFTAYFVHGKDEEVRDLLDRAGIYRRRWDMERTCWAIPVGELENVVQYAGRYNGRTIYTYDDPWARSA